jgi:uncharacterized protein (DUF305 family)
MNAAEGPGLPRGARLLRAAILGLALLLAGVLGWHLGHGTGARRQAAAGTAIAGAVDTGFAQFMIVHHDQAVLMAQILLDHGPSGLTELARTIQATQLLEIGQMRGWLGLWGQPLLPPSRNMDWMLLGRAPPGAELARYLLDCKSAPDGMPGLATIAELTKLRQQEGVERDQLFLQLMIRHHQGALPMARFAAVSAETAVVRKLATQIVYNQSEELARMGGLLVLNQARLDRHETVPVQLVAAQPRPGSEIEFPCHPRRAIGSAYPACKRSNPGHGKVPQ